VSNYGPESSEEGRFERKCVACGAAFRTNYPRQKYCSNACKRRAQNARHFERHQEQIREKARVRQRKRRSAGSA